MSTIIRDKSIGMWTNTELIEYLDTLVCTRDTNENTVVIAESLSRALYGSAQLAQAHGKNAELAERARLFKKALELSIVERRVDQRWDNECEEFDYWIAKAGGPPKSLSSAASGKDGE